MFRYTYKAFFQFFTKFMRKYIIINSNGETVS